VGGRAVIRPFELRDAKGAAALFRTLEPYWIITETGLVHWVQTEPERARSKRWVAEEEKTIVGVAHAGLNWATQADDDAGLDVGVDPDYRGRGIGSELLRLTEEHLLSCGARTLECWSHDPAGHRFLEARGYARDRTERTWSLDPQTVDPAELGWLEQERAREGFRLVSLRELESRIDDVYPLWAETVADIPAEEPEDNISLEEWREGVITRPDLAWEGSAVVLHGEQPVALSWIEVDPIDAKAEHAMTGTLRAFRRRRLARLAKLATIRWAAENGVTKMMTGNDSTNADMLALNEHLGYAPLEPITRFVKRV